MDFHRRRFVRGFLLVAFAAVLGGAGACQRTGARETETPGAPDRAGEAASTSISRVTADQVRQWMHEGRPLAILDSRSASAWAGGTTEAVGAIRVPPDDVDAHLEDIPRDRTIVAYCT